VSPARLVTVGGLSVALAPAVSFRVSFGGAAHKAKGQAVSDALCLTPADFDFCVELVFAALVFAALVFAVAWDSVVFTGSLLCFKEKLIST
jgi:hypothetical protein